MKICLTLRVITYVALVFMVLEVAGPSRVWAADFSSWQKKMPITFAGYNPPGGATPLTNFPALVVLSTNISGFNYGDFKSLTNQDLRFTAADGATELNYEIESWDTNGASYVWLQVTNLVDTNTSVWAFWGKLGTNAPAYAINGATWDTRFRGVWHMQQTNVVDATTNANNGTGKNGITTTSTGLAGSALSLDGADDYVDFGTGLQMGTGSATLSIWFKTTASSLQAGLIGKTSYRAQLGRYALNCGSGNLSGYMDVGSTVQMTTPWTNAYYDNKWHQLTATYNRTGNEILFIDGVQKATNSISAYSAVNMIGTDPFYVGAYGNTSGSGPYAGWYFPGSLDEGRLMTVAVSSNWVWASYMNQASNGVFAGSFNTYGEVQFINPNLPQIANAGSTNVTDSSAEVRGTVLTNGVSAATIRLYWSTNDCNTDAAAWTTSGFVTNLGSHADGTALTNRISGLAANKTYYWNQSASNAAGTFWAANVASSFRTFGPPVVDNGAGPTAIRPSRATLNGTLTAGTTAHVYSYWWTNGAPVTNTYDYGTITEGAFSNTAASLVRSTVYYCRIFATNDYGVAWSAVTNFTSDAGDEPTTVAGCALWFKADAGVYTNASGKVTNWVDQAHGIQATNSSAAPTVPVVTANWTNGVPALYWSAGATYGLTMPAGSLAITNGQSRTIFLVLARGSGEVFGPGTGYMIDIRDDGRIRMRNVNDCYIDAQLQSGVPYILTVVAEAGSPTNVSVYRNGEFVGSTNNFDCAFYPLTNAVGIGWSVYTLSVRGYNGRLAEVVVFDRALGTDDHTAVGRYLSLKYAIPSSYVPAAPTVVSVPGSVIRRNTSAVLAGTPGWMADIRFLWSTNGTLGETMSGWDGSILVTNATASVQVNVMATNLLPATTYYWRCCASNVNGVGWSLTTNSFMTHGTPVSVVQPPVTDGLVLNLDPASLIYTNGEQVDWWPDASGGAVDFTTMAANGKPRYTNSVSALANKPVVSFVSGGGQLGGAAIPAIGTGTNRTAFLVIIPRGGGSDLFGYDTSRRIGQDTTVSRVAIRNGSVAATANLYSSTNSLLSNLPHIVVVADEGGANPATRIYVDGVEGTPYLYANAVSTDRLFGWSMATNMAVGGANFPGREIFADVAQIILYNYVLSRGELNDVGSYLQTKFGISGAYISARGTVYRIR